MIKGHFQCKLCLNSEYCTFPEGRCKPWIYQARGYFIEPYRYRKEDVELMRQSAKKDT